MIECAGNERRAATRKMEQESGWRKAALALRAFVKSIERCFSCEYEIEWVIGAALHRVAIGWIVETNVPTIKPIDRVCLLIMRDAKWGPVRKAIHGVHDRNQVLFPTACADQSSPSTTEKSWSLA